MRDKFAARNLFRCTTFDIFPSQHTFYPTDLLTPQSAFIYLSIILSDTSSPFALQHRALRPAPGSVHRPVHSLIPRLRAIPPPITIFSLIFHHGESRPISMSHHAPTSRSREAPTGDEEATSELKLGEFQNVPTLTLSEARLLINAVMDHRKQQRKVDETEYVFSVFARILGGEYDCRALFGGTDGRRLICILMGDLGHS